MNKPCSKIRLRSTLSLLLLISSAIPGSYASDLVLVAFNASYDLHSGKRHIATTELELTRTDQGWRWSSLTTARGIYAWFTRKRPYTETSFSRVDSDFRLNEILIADAGKRKNQEVANFDWGKGQVKILRRGKRKTLPLGAEVYDYQSIHLLAATMQQRQLTEKTIDFYRKGKLVKSSLVFSGRQSLELDGKFLDVNVYQQTIASSDSEIRYYYDATNPLLPIRIEKLESGEKPAILTLRGIDGKL